MDCTYEPIRSLACGGARSIKGVRPVLEHPASLVPVNENFLKSSSPYVFCQ